MGVWRIAPGCKFDCKYVLTGKIDQDPLEVIVFRFEFLIFETHLQIC